MSSTTHAPSSNTSNNTKVKHPAPVRHSSTHTGNKLAVSNTKLIHTTSTPSSTRACMASICTPGPLTSSAHHTPALMLNAHSVCANPHVRIMLTMAGGIIHIVTTPTTCACNIHSRGAFIHCSVCAA